MAFKWKDDWAVGNEMIDFQHRELFGAIDNLIAACYVGKALDVINKTVDFLLDYVVKHFNDEENLQRSSGYPDHQNHKKLHEAFKKTAKELGDKLKAEGPNSVLIMKINSTIGEWLINHILGEDKKIGEHLRTKNK